MQTDSLYKRLPGLKPPQKTLSLPSEDSRTCRMKLCPSPLSPKCEIVPLKKCIFESSLKNTETQQGGLHGEASIGSTETAMVSDDHCSETKWAEHKKLVCREWCAAFKLLQLAAKNEECVVAVLQRLIVEQPVQLCPLHRGRGCAGCDHGAADGTGLPYLQ